MNDSFTITGGAKIGRAHATYPFASLYVDKDVLKINASIVGNLVFLPGDIISIEPYKMLFITGQGIRINHRVDNYNSRVIFSSFTHPDFLISEIRKVGFLDNINSKVSFAYERIIKRQQQQGNFPIKKSVAIIFVVLWNLLFLSDLVPYYLQNKNEGSPFGNGIKAAVAMLLMTSLLTAVSNNFRKVILKEGRNFDHIKRFIYFVILVSAVMFLTLITINSADKMILLRALRSL